MGTVRVKPSDSFIKIVAAGTHQRLSATSPRYRGVLARAALETQAGEPQLSGAQGDDAEEELLDLPGVGD